MPDSALDSAPDPLPAGPVSLDLLGDPVALTRQLCDVQSVSLAEGELADLVQAALEKVPHLLVRRDGNAVVASTQGSASQRVVIAGHLDTVPVTGNLPTRSVIEDGEEVIYGRGTADMKGGVAIMLAAAASVAEPVREVTYVFYDAEEIEAKHNGLGRLMRQHPDWIQGEFGVLCEPTDGQIEGGCQGTLRVQVTVPGVAAHSARSWMGVNAIHDAEPVLARLRSYVPRQVEVDGLVYREGLNAVGIQGGIAGNVIPDSCTVTVNFRFAPDRDEEAAVAHVREVFEGYQVDVTDLAAAARPGLDHPACADFVAAIGGTPRAKYGWTDVARLASHGIPAVNFGPGDPSVAHQQDERVRAASIRECATAMQRWLRGA